MIIFSDIIDRIKEQNGIKYDHEVAKLFNIQSNVLANYKTRNNIPYKKIIHICLENNLSLDYILLGKTKVENSNFLTLFNQLSENEQRYYELSIERDLLKKKIDTNQ